MFYYSAKLNFSELAKSACSSASSSYGVERGCPRAGWTSLRPRSFGEAHSVGSGTAQYRWRIRGRRRRDVTGQVTCLAGRVRIGCRCRDRSELRHVAGGVCAQWAERYRPMQTADAAMRCSDAGGELERDTHPRAPSKVGQGERRRQGRAVQCEQVSTVRVGNATELRSVYASAMHDYDMRWRHEQC